MKEILRLSPVLSVFILICSFGYAQQPEEGKVITIHEIPAGMTRTTKDIAGFIDRYYGPELEKIRAAYAWTTGNIRFSVKDMYKNEYFTSPGEVIRKTLAERKAVCQGYAEVFSAIVQDLGFPARVIPGCTRQGGKVSRMSHAWVAVRVRNDWLLSDPAWDAGYISGDRFFPKPGFDHFLQEPGIFIKTHYPFDPLWQLLEYPVAYSDFEAGRTGRFKEGTVFHYVDSVQVYLYLSEKSQYEAMIRRIRKTGLYNDLITAFFNEKIKGLEVIIHNINAGYINGSVAIYNDAVGIFNRYIEAKNRQFKDPDVSDDELRNLMETITRKLTDASDTIYKVSTTEKELLTLTRKNLEAMNDLKARVEEESRFLGKYFNTPGALRIFLFMKVPGNG